MLFVKKIASHHALANLPGSYNTAFNDLLTMTPVSGRLLAFKLPGSLIGLMAHVEKLEKAGPGPALSFAK